MAVYRNTKKKAVVETKDTGVSNEAMQRLAQIMNDSPSLAKLQGTEWEIRGLRIGTMWLISEEAARMDYREGLATGDALKEIASNIDSVVFIITCALLNDKHRIFGNDGEHGFTYGGRVYSEEFGMVFDTLKWGEFNPQEWLNIFVEVMLLINIDFFFESTKLIKTVRQLVLQRKETRTDARQ